MIERVVSSLDSQTFMPCTVHGEQQSQPNFEPINGSLNAQESHSEHSASVLMLQCNVVIRKATSLSMNVYYYYLCDPAAERPQITELDIVHAPLKDIAIV